MDMRYFVPFWMVWCPMAGAPTVQHPSLAAAEAEARRLAAKHPDRKFFVLHTVGMMAVEAPVQQFFPLDMPPRPIPPKGPS